MEKGPGSEIGQGSVGTGGRREQATAAALMLSWVPGRQRPAPVAGFMISDQLLGLMCPSA